MEKKNNNDVSSSFNIVVNFFQNCHPSQVCGVFYAPNTISWPNFTPLSSSGGLWSTCTTSEAKIGFQRFPELVKTSMPSTESRPEVILAFKVGRAVGKSGPATTTSRQKSFRRHHRRHIPAVTVEKSKLFEAVL